MRRHLNLPLVSALAAVLVVYVSFASTTPGFATSNVLFIVLGQFPVFGLAALGLGVTMMAGEFDLAFPYTATLTGMLAMRTAGGGIVLGIAIGVGAGMLIGLLQGLAIYLLRIPSLVFTLCTGFVFAGAAYMVSNTTIVSPDITFGLSLQSRIGIFSPSSLIALGIYGTLGLFLAYVRFGREILAIGGGRDEAISAGVPLVRPLVVAFGISGTLAGLTGALVAAQTGVASPEAFDTLLLNAVTAAFIGGVSLRGGRGNPLGIALGVFTLGLLMSGLSLRGAPYYTTTLVTAGVLLLLIVIDLATPRIARLARRLRPSKPFTKSTRVPV
jgi:ribose transport system permease protein